MERDNPLNPIKPAIFPVSSITLVHFSPSNESVATIEAVYLSHPHIDKMNVDILASHCLYHLTVLKRFCWQYSVMTDIFKVIRSR